ncbi:MAG: type II toxin-antitoxin system HipA family toxin [Bacteroidales bacterium]|nr:type II toxin-antitoxin system HipA family toxin [Bacteroidales bacterium]
MNSIEKIIVSTGNSIVGQLALTKDSICAFQYDNGWLKNGFSISPFELPLQKGVFLAKRSPFNGNFGVFDDSLPDGWGMLLLDRLIRSKGYNPNSVSILELLAFVGSNGRGALTFQPDYSSSYSNEKVDFLSIESEINKLLSSEKNDNTSIEELWKRGGSPGGARPKIFVKFNDCEWLVKFPAKYDDPNLGIKEYNYSLLAKKCGVEMPETKLFEERFFGVKRFDRSEDGTRFHTISAAGLLGADYRTPSLDYLQLMQLTRILTSKESEVWRMFRLMVFNYLIGNKDDHAKNFSFIYIDNSWQMSPAYDLLPSNGFNGYHTTTINSNINPTEKDIVQVAIKSGLDERKAKKTLEDMRGIVNVDSK